MPTFVALYGVNTTVPFGSSVALEYAGPESFGTGFIPYEGLSVLYTISSESNVANLLLLSNVEKILVYGLNIPIFCDVAGTHTTRPSGKLIALLYTFVPLSGLNTPEPVVAIAFGDCTTICE
jgi:hypothetical protein